MYLLVTEPSAWPTRGAMVTSVNSDRWQYPKAETEVVRRHIRQREACSNGSDLSGRTVSGACLEICTDLGRTDFRGLVRCGRSATIGSG